MLYDNHSQWFQKYLIDLMDESSVQSPQSKQTRREQKQFRQQNSNERNKSDPRIKPLIKLEVQVPWLLVN